MAKKLINISRTVQYLKRRTTGNLYASSIILNPGKVITVSDEDYTLMTIDPTKITVVFVVDDLIDSAEEVNQLIADAGGIGVPTDTDGLSEGILNLYFTDARARIAAVADLITDAVTTVAPSQNAVFDALALKIDLSEKGTALGVAPLDGANKLPVLHLPNSILIYKGMWDASLNSPLLTDGTGVAGWVYRVSVAGTQFTPAISFAVGDYTIHNGTKWEKADTTDSVVSVNGMTGVIALDTDDIPEGSNIYFTTLRARTAAVSDSITDSITDIAPSQNAVFDALALKSNVGHSHIATDISDFTAAAKAATVTDAIVNGVLDVAPSQNAVFDALALKADSSSVPANTDALSEGSTNKYFTDTRARTAAVADSITDAVTNIAPSQNAVFDALALKAPRWTVSVRTSAYLAVTHNAIFADSTAAPFTITLPVAPVAGDTVLISDYAGTWATNNVTVGRNGQNINASATDLILDVDGATATLLYVDSTLGWKVL